jgi:autotransporter-associated beta strand protein
MKIPACLLTTRLAVALPLPLFAASMPVAQAQINGVNDNITSANLGNSGYYSLPTITGLGGDLTIEGWVNLSSYASWGRIADLGGGSTSNNIFLATQSTSGKPMFTVYSADTIIGTIVGPSALGTNTWVHVAGVVQADRTMRLYVNGTQVGTTVASADVPTVNRTSNYIGKSNWSGDSLLDGAVADVRVWNSARTAAEIQNNMDVGSISGPTTGLVAAYPFGDTGSTPTADVSGNGYTATQSGSISYSKFDTGTLTTGGFSGNSTTVNVAAGTLDLNGTNSIRNMTLNSGNVTQSTGTLLTNHNVDSFQVGQANGTTSTYALSGGSITLGNSGMAQIGSYGNGTMNQTGGNVTTGSWTVMGRYASSNGTYNISSGSLTQTNASTRILVGEEGRGTLNIGGNGVVTSAGGLGVGWLATANGTVNLNGGTLITANVTKGSGSGSLNFNGGTLQASGNSTTFMTGLTSAAIQSGGGTINDSGYAITIGQAFSGNGALTKVGLGTTTLSGSNTYTGGTTISAGTLQVGSSSAFGTGAVVNNSTLGYDSSSSFTVNNTISGTGSLQKAGTGTLTLTGNNSYSGASTISAGTLQIGTGGTSGMFGTGALTNNGTLAINRSDSLTLANAISGTGSLTKSANNTLTLTGNNTYSGGTTISAGTLQIGDGTNSTARAGTGVLAVGGNTLSLNLNGNATLGHSSVTSSGLIQNLGTGRVTLANGALSGTLDGGTSGIVLSNLISSDIALKGDVTLGSNDSSRTVYATAPGATARIVNAGSFWWLGSTTTANALNLDIASGVTAALNASQNGGTLYYNNLSGAGNFAYNSVNGAGIFLGTSTLSGTLTAGNRDISFGNGGATGDAGATRIVANSNVAFNSTTNSTYSGLMSGGGALVKSAANTLTLTGNNTYTGTTTISGGTLQVGGGGTTGALGTGSVTNNGALVFNRSNAMTVANAISGNGSVTKNGVGTLTISGSNTNTGGTIVNAGTLSLAASNLLADSGSVTINSGGTFNLASNGDYIGTLAMNGNATVAGTSGPGGGQFILTQGASPAPRA